MPNIICDANPVVISAGSLQELISDLEKDGKKGFRDDNKFGLKIGIVNDEKHENLNIDCLAILQKAGLRQHQDYQIASLPRAFNEVYPVPVLWVSEQNRWGLKKETFFGREGIECFAEYFNPIVYGK